MSMMEVRQLHWQSINRCVFIFTSNEGLVSASDAVCIFFGNIGNILIFLSFFLKKYFTIDSRMQLKVSNFSCSVLFTCFLVDIPLFLQAFHSIAKCVTALTFVCKHEAEAVVIQFIGDVMVCEGYTGALYCHVCIISATCFYRILP